MTYSRIPDGPFFEALEPRLLLTTALGDSDLDAAMGAVVAAQSPPATPPPAPHPSSRTVQYMLKINGQDVEQIRSTDLSGEFTVSVLVNIQDPYWRWWLDSGGLFLYSFDLIDSGGALTPTQGIGGPSDSGPSGNWNSTSVSPLVNFAGQVDVRGSDVYQQTGMVPPPDFAAYYDTFGAGPNVWTQVCSGEFTWDGSTSTTLTLAPGGLGGHLVAYMSGSRQVAVLFPTATRGDSVDFIGIPEIAIDVPDGDVVTPGDGGLTIGIDDDDADDDVLTISADSNEANLTLTIPTGNLLGRLNSVESDGTTVIGSIVVEPFDDTSLATDRLISLNDQFFTTARLDEAHMVSGQLISGWNVLETISELPTDGSNRPLDPPLPDSVDIFSNDLGGLLSLTG